MKSALLRTASFVCLISFAIASPQGSDATADPLKSAIDATRASAAALPTSDELWAQLAPGVDGLLARTDAAYERDRRELALLTLAYAFENVAAHVYVGEHRAERADLAALEKLWTSSSRAFDARALAALRTRATALHPALVRALAEAAVEKLGVYLAASLEYGQSTTAESGLFYLGLAHAQAQFVELCERLSESGGASLWTPRKLTGELERLDHALLALYQPPFSIDRHPDFISAAGTLKEARELDEAGLAYAALLRFAQAEQRFGTLKSAADATASTISARIESLVTKLTEFPLDHSIALAFQERAEELLESGTLDGASAATDALAAYVGVLATPLAVPTPTKAELTLTLVRWPYT